MSLTQAIASWISRTSYSAIPTEAIEAGNVSCFDALGVALLGSKAPLGRTLLAYADACGGHPQSSIVGRREPTSSALAAMVNGACAHAMDFDNAGGFGHPAAVLFPAILAVAERQRSSGQALLEAYVIGCEVGLALYYGGGGAKHAYRQMERGFHSTPVFGRVAAAAACAKLLKLDEVAIASALGTAASSAAGLVCNFGTMTKALHAGDAARDGLIAAELAARGITSAKDVLEHPLGFVRTFFGDRRINHELIVARLGKVYLTPITYSLKRHPTCGFNSSVTETLSNVIAAGECRATEITAIEIVMTDASSEVLLFSIPKSALEAKFSVRYNAAVAALGREDALFAHADDQALDPAIMQFMEKITVRIEPSVARAPHPDRGAVPVRITLADGRTLERATPASEVEGASTRPLSRERVVAKFRKNALAVFGKDRVDALVETFADIRGIDDVSVAAALVRA